MTTDRAALLYLDLLKRCVTNLIYEDPAIRQPWDDSSTEEYLPFDRERRETARDRPSQAHTMIGCAGWTRCSGRSPRSSPPASRAT